MKPNHAMRVSWSERLLSVLILVGLIGLGFWILYPLVRPTFESPQAKPDLQIVDDVPPVSATRLMMERLAPAGFEPIGTTQSYTPSTAYEKINGKVEFYIPLGLRSLTCQRFVSSTQSELFFELFVYELATPDGAFSAFTLQRREGARESTAVPYAYVSENALIVLHGHWYLELIGSSPSPALIGAMEESARRFITAEPANTQIPAEVSWFPRAHLKPNTITLTLENGFGFEPFKRLFAASCTISDMVVQVFFVPTASDQDALNLLAEYSSFLIDNGAIFETALADISGSRVYNVFGTYEVVFTVGAVLGGVHQADHLAAATEAARALYGNLANKQNDSAKQ